LDVPDDVVARLDRAISEIVQDPDIRRRMNDAGINPEHIGPAAFAVKIRDDAARYETIIRQAGIHFD
jgi:tripartite-type tricarboxylate transporter receptor subunit TctC